MTRTHRSGQLAALFLLAACGWQSDEAALATPARPPAAALASMRQAMPLEEMLTLLDDDLRVAIDGAVIGDAEAALIRAEAITDRLLEARLPFRWMAAQPYRLEARLRQIQSQADRAVAALLSGLPREQVVAETVVLHNQVTTLRAAIQAGGGPPRPPVSELIEALDTARGPVGGVPRPVTQPTQPAPPLLGTPVDTTTA